MIKPYLRRVLLLLTLSAFFVVPSAFAQDADLDGLSNSEEQILGTSPYGSDSDGDGFKDLAEVYPYQVVPGSFTFAQAKADAAAKGGWLAVIDSPKKLYQIKRALTDLQLNPLPIPLPNNYDPQVTLANGLWIGASDSSVAGRFQWGPSIANPLTSQNGPDVGSVSSGDLVPGSNQVTNVVNIGAFTVGRPLVASGVPSGTTITAVDTVARSLTLSNPVDAILSPRISQISVTHGGYGYNDPSLIRPIFTGGDVGLSSISVTSSGSSYTSPPTVKLTGGGATTQGEAYATLNPSGQVDKITITSRGAGYTSDPTVTLSGGGVGFSSVEVTNPGSGYTSAPKVEFSGGLGLSSINILGSGSGYTSEPTITLTGGIGLSSIDVTDAGLYTSDVAPRVTVTGGIANGVESAAVAIPGSNYTEPPTVTIDGGGGSGAEATAIMSGNQVVGISITNPGTNYTANPTVNLTGGIGLKDIQLTGVGSGYTTAPKVEFDGGGGRGAAATAIVSKEKVIRIDITDYGTDYTSNPTIRITGGGGTGATASANVGTPASGATAQIGTGTPAQAVAIMSPSFNGCWEVSKVVITNPGSGYTTKPTIQVLPASNALIDAEADSQIGTPGTAVATIDPNNGGLVTGITITSPGTNYTNPPTVNFSGGGAPAPASATAVLSTPATATATVDAKGEVTGVTIISPGTNYTSAPAITISGGGGTGATAAAVYAGTPAEATASLGNDPTLDFTVADGRIQAIAVTNDGNKYYTTAPTVSITGGSGGGATAVVSLTPPATAQLQSISVVDAGSGYKTAPTVAIQPSLSGASALASIDGSGKVTGFAVTNPGTGYVTAPTVTLGGSGEITKIQVNTKGINYKTAPTVSFVGGGGTGAAATATVSGGFVTGITITNAGSGYTNDPEVKLSGGSASTFATATATISKGATAVASIRQLSAPIHSPVPGGYVNWPAGGPPANTSGLSQAVFLKASLPTTPPTTPPTASLFDWDTDVILGGTPRGYLLEMPATDPKGTDTDGDLLSDADEMIKYKTNPLVADTDGDGLSDWQELITYKTNPLLKDTDGDGLSDKVEILDWKSSPFLIDTDGDLVSDFDEVNAIPRTDPTDPSKYPNSGIRQLALLHSLSVQVGNDQSVSIDEAFASFGHRPDRDKVGNDGSSVIIDRQGVLIWANKSGTSLTIPNSSYARTLHVSNTECLVYNNRYKDWNSQSHKAEIIIYRRGATGGIISSKPVTIDGTVLDTASVTPTVNGYMLVSGSRVDDGAESKFTTFTSSSSFENKVDEWDVLDLSLNLITWDGIPKPLAGSRFSIPKNIGADFTDQVVLGYGSDGSLVINMTTSNDYYADNIGDSFVSKKSSIWISAEPGKEGITSLKTTVETLAYVDNRRVIGQTAATAAITTTTPPTPAVAGKLLDYLNGTLSTAAVPTLQTGESVLPFSTDSIKGLSPYIYTIDAAGTSLRLYRADVTIAALGNAVTLPFAIQSSADFVRNPRDGSLLIKGDGGKLIWVPTTTSAGALAPTGLDTPRIILNSDQAKPLFVKANECVVWLNSDEPAINGSLPNAKISHFQIDATGQLVTTSLTPPMAGKSVVAPTRLTPDPDLEGWYLTTYEKNAPASTLRRTYELQVASSADRDQDGISDYKEMTETFTDPGDPDTDGDGLLDGQEARPYQIVTTALSWEAARLDAISKGGHLAVLDTQKKQDAFKAAMQFQKADGKYWIGGHDITTEGSFQWLDAKGRIQWLDASGLIITVPGISAPKYWDQSQPSNLNNADGMEVTSGSDYKWSMAQTSKLQGYVIEFAPSLPNKADTDEDGPNDGYERANLTDPTDPNSFTAYTLTLANGGVVTGGGFSKTSGTLAYGTNATLEAAPAVGYLLQAWTGDLSGTALTQALLMNGNKAVGATFAPDTRDSDGDGLTNYDELVIYLTDPEDITSVPTYTLTLANSGVVTGGGFSMTSGTLVHGTIATLEASPAVGYLLQAWTGDLSGSTLMKTLLMSGNKTVGATFVRDLADDDSDGLTNYDELVVYKTNPKNANTDGDNDTDKFEVDNGTDPTDSTKFTTYTVTLVGDGQVKDGLAVSGNFAASPTGSQLKGVTVTLTPTAQPGYKFSSWTGDATGSLNPQTLVLNGNKSVGATFVRDLADDDRDGLTNYDELVVYKTNPNDPNTDGDNDTDKFEVDNGTDPTDSTKFTTYTVTLVGDGQVKDGTAVSGTFAASPTGKQLKGVIVTLTPTAQPGYKFSSWTGDATGSVNPQTLVLNGDKSVNATFVRDLADDDKDGLTNYDELVSFGTNPNKADSDSDGLSDKVETNTEIYVSATNTGTNPNKANSDDDGLLDGVETNTGTWVSIRNTGTNPNKADMDGDGLKDGVETNTGIYGSITDTGTNPFKADTDADGLNDKVETNTVIYVSATNTGTNPNNADSDDDGLKDGVETKTGVWVSATQTGTDPNKDNSDGDSLKDGVETNTGIYKSVLDTGTNPNKDDTDGDGLKDNVETNTGIYVSITNTGTNPNKDDTDNDGLKDKVETGTKTWVSATNTGTNPNNADSDADGLNDKVESGTKIWVSAMQTGTDPNKDDTDGDGLKDKVETNTGIYVSSANTGTNPNKADADSDGDGLIDSVETGTKIWVSKTDTGTDPTKADSDNDGLKDGFETNTGVWVWNENTGTNPNKADTDGDGLNDKVETNTGIYGSLTDTGTNPFKADTDADGLNDKVETGTKTWVSATNTGTNPNKADSDDDSLKDGVETKTEIWVSATQTGTNPNRDDSDVDGLKDSFETNTGVYKSALDTGSNPNKADTDGDGLNDKVETNTGIYVSITNTGTNPNRDDTDNDGLKDKVETGTKTWVSATNTGTNPNKADSDDDSLKDGVETNTKTWVSATQTGTNPNRDDSDVDGLKDGFETNTGVYKSALDTGTNPNKADTDGDGLNDNVETNTGIYVSITGTGTNPNKDDTDNDGLKDKVETGTKTWVSATNTGTNPNNADSDGDSLKDGIETNTKTWVSAAQTGTDPNKDDTDGDSLKDSFETNSGTHKSVLDTGTDPNKDDTDGDGLKDKVETNTGIYVSSTNTGTNPNRADADSDGDGLLNIVETKTVVWLSPANTGTDPQNSDSDNDGMNDGVETNTGVYVSITNTGTNPNKDDTDGDGLKDNVETNTGINVSITNTGTNPNKANTDNDGDGLIDVLEKHYSTDVKKKDTDGDGLWDGAEVNIYKTDPLNPDTDGDGLSDGGKEFVGSSTVPSGNTLSYSNALVCVDYEGLVMDPATGIAFKQTLRLTNTRSFTSKLLGLEGDCSYKGTFKPQGTFEEANPDNLQEMGGWSFVKMKLVYQNVSGTYYIQGYFENEAGDQIGFELRPARKDAKYAGKQLNFEASVTGSPAGPTGSAVATGSISKTTGVANFSVYFPDGSRGSYSGAIVDGRDKGGSLLMPYSFGDLASSPLLVGVSVLRTTADQSDVDGTVRLYSSTSDSASLYPDGFDQLRKLKGSFYVAPTSSQLPLPTFVGVNNTLYRWTDESGTGLTGVGTWTTSTLSLSSGPAQGGSATVDRASGLVTVSRIPGIGSEMRQGKAVVLQISKSVKGFYSSPRSMGSLMLAPNVSRIPAAVPPIISPTSYSAKAPAVTYPVTVKATGPWAVYIPTGATWVTATLANNSGTPATPTLIDGSGNGTVNIIVAPNTTNSNRTAVISIAGVDHTITQEFQPKSISSKSYSAAAVGGSYAVSVTGLGDWDVSVPSNVAWVTASRESGSGNGTVTITVDPNATSSNRTAVIGIAGVMHTITQAFQTKSISPPSYSGSNAAVSYQVKVVAVGPWSVLIPSDASSWVTATPLSGNGSGTVTITLAKNGTTVQTHKNRSTTITIAGCPHTISQTWK